MKVIKSIFLTGDEIVNIVHDFLLDAEAEVSTMSSSELDRTIDGDRDYRFEIATIKEKEIK